MLVTLQRLLLFTNHYHCFHHLKCCCRKGILHEEFTVRRDRCSTDIEASEATCNCKIGFIEILLLKVKFNINNRGYL